MKLTFAFVMKGVPFFRVYITVATIQINHMEQLPIYLSILMEMFS